MDRVDLRIFTRLVGDPLLSDETIGRDVGITGKAVRLRRKRLESEGVLTEYGVHPRAEVLGRHATASRYTGGALSEVARSQLRKVEDLVLVRSFRPNFHMVVRFSNEAEPSDDPTLARVLGRRLEGSLDERPPRSLLRADELTRADWKVLEAVVRNPRAPYSVQSHQAGLSPRTFRRHRAKLDAGRVLECSMILNLEREEGLATYGIWLKVDRSFDERALELPRLWDRPHWTRNPRGVYLLGSADNYLGAREVEIRLRAVPGVLSADPLVPAGGLYARERLLAWVRAERDSRFPLGSRGQA